MMKRALFALTLSIGLAGSAWSAPWIHLEVVDGTGTEVNVNLPLSAVEVALEIAEGEAFEDGALRIDNTDITVDELRSIWRELRESGDGEYVHVREDDEQVRIYREKDHIFVEVNEGSDDTGEHVSLQIPLVVVDALFSGDGDKLNIKAAIKELHRTKKGEVIRVQDGNEQVRIWID